MFVFSKNKMKCLLCSSKLKDQKDLLNHYVTNHNVDENNWFFQKLFQIKDKSLLKRCLRCDEFLVTDKHKDVHNFLKHYDDGKTIPFEEKPLNILKLPALTVYSIEFKKHQNFYDFYNSELCVDDFLRNVKHKLKAGSKKWIKCSFTIENIQKSLFQGLQLILNTRYWITPTYDGVYFNDFIFFGFKQDILSRVIINGMSGSSCHFKQFISLAAKILDNDARTVV